MSYRDRRNFLVAAIHGLGTIMAAGLGIPSLIYLFSPSKARASGWIDVADISTLPVGEPSELTFQRRRIDGWKVVDEKATAWIVKSSEKELFALAPGCTHLGCAYKWVSESKQFLCPCHTSTFAVDGKVISGPAPRPLDRYASRVQNGKLQLGAVQVSRG